MTKEVKKQRVRVGNIGDMPGLMVELGKLYKSARRLAGPNVDPSTALTLAKILVLQRGLIETSDLAVQLKAALAQFEELRQSIGPAKRGGRALR